MIAGFVWAVGSIDFRMRDSKLSDASAFLYRDPSRYTKLQNLIQAYAHDPDSPSRRPDFLNDHALSSSAQLEKPRAGPSLAEVHETGARNSGDLSLARLIDTNVRRFIELPCSSLE